MDDYKLCRRDENAVPVQTSIRALCDIEDRLCLAIRSPAGDKQAIGSGWVEPHDGIWVQTAQQGIQILAGVRYQM